MNKSIILSKIRNWIIEIKVMMNRTLSYINLLNSGLIIFLAVSKLKDMGYINIDLTSFLIPLYIISVIMLLSMGYLESKILGGYQRENQRQFDFNPPMVEMKNKIDEIYQKINNLEEKTK